MGFFGRKRTARVTRFVYHRLEMGHRIFGALLRRLPWKLTVSACKVCLSSVFRFSSLLLSAFLSLLYRSSHSYSNVTEVRSSSHGAEVHIYCYQRVLDNERSLQ